MTAVPARAARRFGLRCRLAERLDGQQRSWPLDDGRWSRAIPGSGAHQRGLNLSSPAFRDCHCIAPVQSIDDKSFFKNAVLQTALKKAKEGKGRVHFLGLVRHASVRLNLASFLSLCAAAMVVCIVTSITCSASWTRRSRPRCRTRSCTSSLTAAVRHFDSTNSTSWQIACCLISADTPPTSATKYIEQLQKHLHAQVCSRALPTF